MASRLNFQTPLRPDRHFHRPATSSRTDRDAERRRRPPQEELERLASQLRPSNAGPMVSRPFRPHRVVNLSTPGHRPTASEALGSVLPAPWAGRAGRSRHVLSEGVPANRCLPLAPVCASDLGGL